MRQKTLLLAFFLLVGFVVQAQQKITGVVTSSEDGLPIPGVSVVVKGQETLGTATNIDGQYSLTVPNDAQILLFTSVGMKEMEVTIEGRTKIDVVMEPQTLEMDEVVVVAYGTKTKRAITGAVTSLDQEVLEKQTAISPISAIQGSAPGVNILTSGGQPGENPTVRIRGIGSVNASAEPLYVVDGVVFSGNINSISQDQIESMNVLKDASASALYGSRASNGVILITTKGGKFGKRDAKITFNAKAGISAPAVEMYDLVGAKDHMKYSWESYRNGLMEAENPLSLTEANAKASSDFITSHTKYNPFNVAQPIDKNGNVVEGAELLWDTDWYDELTNDNPIYNEYSLSADGGTESLTYFVNGNYLTQEGSIIESDFERISGRVNLTARLRPWLELGTNSSFAKSTQNYPEQSGNSYTSVLQWVYSVAPIYPLYQRDAVGNFVLDDNKQKMYDYGNFGGLINGNRPAINGDNAVSATQLNDIEYTRTNIFTSNYAKFIITDDLNIQSKFGYERYLYDEYTYDHYKYGAASGVNGRVSQERNIVETTSLTNSINYSKSFNEHAINVSVIQEMFDYNYDFFSAQGTGFLPNVTVLNGSTLPENVGGYLTAERLLSYMGRFDYALKNKYFIDFSYRRDASSRFKDGNRWGDFYSVGGSWVISDEAFLSSIEAISMLKLRSSYGELGNNRGIGYFPYMSAYNTGWNEITNTGVLLGGIVDENIEWEKTGLFNVAIDYGFLNNRINGTIEYYNKESIDLLFDKPLSPSTGNTEVTTNIGTVQNSGFEFMINTINIHTNDVYWKTSFNISTNKNELKKLPQEFILNGTKRWEVGRSIYDFYIREYAGVDPKDGDALWYIDETDKDGNPTGKKVTTDKYSDATKYYQGSALPDFTGGFNSYITYKNFDFNLLFNFSFGGQILDYQYARLMNSCDGDGGALHTDIEDRWQKEGDITDVPRLTTSKNEFNATSTRFLFDNDYIRLKALTLGYTLPKPLMDRINIEGARVYIQADNIWTWQSHKGLDPEQSLAGTTDNRSNIMKTISVGVNINF